MKIRYVKPEEIKGFYGMNPEAAKHFHIKHYPKNTIEVDARCGEKMRKEIIRHELIEYDLMKHKHMRYHEADKVAKEFENKKKLVR